ncbi:MAG: MarR family transcriptional regulator [Anaerolineae bacterium]
MMGDWSKGESVDFLLAQVCRLHHARAHALLEGVGLYRGQPPVLHALWKEEGLTHTELAERVHVTPATLTKMLQRMERAGFLIRRPDPEDQRVSRVYLTEAGRAIQTQVEAVWRQMEAESLAGFSAEELQQLREFLLRIRENLLRVTDGHLPPPKPGRRSGDRPPHRR